MSPSGAFTLLPHAEEDLLQIAAYVGRSVPTKTVDFLRAARATMDILAGSPFMGSPQPFQEAEYHSLRRFRVTRFPSYLTWYRPLASGNGIVVWRVLHSSQDVLPRLKESLES